MGYVDADTHVRENERTWAYFDPAERHLAPKGAGTQLRVEDIPLNPFDRGAQSELFDRTFPLGSVDLSDPGARITRMDELGVDVHVMFSTWWINAEVHDPVTEAALARSWNR